MKKKLYIALLSGLFVVSSFSAQTLDEARELYKIGAYERAMPIFEKELISKPTDPSLNQWYGVCLFETNGDLVKAEECISVAAKKNIQDAYLYLGKIYAKTYRFDLAEKEFDRYGKLKRRDKDAMAKLDTEKAWLTSLKKMASRPEDIQIIDSIVVDKNSFLSAYNLSLSGGKVDYSTSFFSQASNKGKTIYQNEKKDKVYYSQQKEGGDVNTIYSMEKLLDEYGNEKPISSDNFGIEGSLDFPFVMADGVTLYFAGQNPDNMNAYELYVTRYNMNNDTYLAPERLNAPFNSPFNDYMYVVDEEKGVGWFASDRFQPDDKVCVYTFIPNPSVQMVDSDNDTYLFDRSKIKSIKDSWKPNTNYNKQISIARKEVLEIEEKPKDFEFVINDRYTYYTLNDFKNSFAKNSFKEVLEKRKVLDNLNKQLSLLRDSYNSSASNNKAQEILRLENQKPILLQEIEDLEIRSRNQEITNLNK